MSKENKETLIIKNFGPIKDIKLDLKKINILIGEQATGKSTIAKVLAVCRYFSYIVDYNLVPQGSVGRRESAFYQGLFDWGIASYKKENTYIFYKSKDYTIEVSTKLESFNVGLDDNEKYITKKIPVSYCEIIEKSKKFKKLLSELEDIKPKQTYLLDPNWHPSENFFRLNVKSVMNNPFYFPTERGLQSIFSLGKSPNYSDTLYGQLASLYNIADKYKTETEIEHLEIHYKNENGKGLTRKNDELSFYNLSNGASGYQSSIPIVLGIKYYTGIEKRKRTFIVEEPEINLFPSTQKKLMAFFIKNVNENGHSFIIPTHSPYFLSAINDYLMAYKKGQLNKKATKKIIKEEYWLNVDDISCYQLKNGKAKSIIDKKTGLISDNIIDEVSDDMNDEFENLLDIR